MKSVDLPAARPRTLSSADRKLDGYVLPWPQRAGIDQVMVEERAAGFAKRSIKAKAKLAGLKMAVALMDLTRLAGNERPGKIAYLCRKALQPAEPRRDVPSSAAFRVHPHLRTH